MKTPKSTQARPDTIDAYLRGVDPDKRAALQKLRKTIHAAYPRADECISYGIPAFRLDGKLLVWFGAGAHHCALYPGGVVDELSDELAGYEISKGTVRFQPDAPLPAALVRKLLAARIARGGVRKRPAKAKARTSGPRRAARR
jgi:uncharacterized protein YdhG (YjbR/CyaY superfamily)